MTLRRSEPALAAQQQRVRVHGVLPVEGSLLRTQLQENGGFSVRLLSHVTTVYKRIACLIHHL